MTEIDYEPRHLHPASMLIRLARRAPTALGALVLIVLIGRDDPMTLAILGLFVVAAGLIDAWIDWRTFTYQITDDELATESGWFSREYRSVPRQRIQDVSIEQDLAGRVLGLVSVKIETGGGDVDEVWLQGITPAEARRLRALMVHGGTAMGTAEAQAALPPPDLIFAMPLPRVLLQGLFSFSFIWIAVLGGMLAMADRVLDLDWLDLLYAAAGTITAWLTLGVTATAIGLILALGWITGLMTTISRDYNFHLFHARGRFRRVRGLSTRTEVVVANDRIQLGLVRRGAVSGRLGWCAVEVQTLGGSDDRGGRQQLAPFARADEAARLIAASGLPPFARAALQSVDGTHATCAAIRLAGPILVVAGIGGFFLPVVWLGLLLVPPAIAIARLQPGHHRYASLGTSLQLTRGVVVQRDWILPYGSIQAVCVRESWLQRRLGVATVIAATAGGRGRAKPFVNDVAAGDAAKLVRTLLDRAEG